MITAVCTDELSTVVLQAQAGCRDAFDELVTRFESRVYSIVMQRLRNSAEADEVTQEVFLRAYRKLSQLIDPERFSGWLCQIAVRLSINRAVRRPPESTRAPGAFDVFESEPKSPFSELVRIENIEQVRVGMAQLRELDRDTLWAFYFEGSSLKEMAEQFSSPIGTIKRRLHTARGRLRDAIGGTQLA
jgi:RNA polymerase sigma-70 factor, ECF subfamily